MQVKPKLEDLVPESALEEETRRVKEVAAKEDQGAEGSEVDWGSEGESESSKDEDGGPTEEEEEAGEEVPTVAPAASEPAAESSVSPASAAEHPLRELSSGELQMIGIWTSRPVGCQRAMEHWLLASHRRIEKQAAAKAGERRVLEANLSQITNQEITNEVLARLLGGQLTQEEEDAVARLERSQSREAVMARAARLHALRRMLDHASTAGDILEARLHSTGNFLEGRPYTENAYTALTYTKTGFHGHQAISRTHRRFHVHTGVFTIFTFFHVHSWFFHVHLHTFSRTYFGFHVHLLFSRPRPVFTYTPSFSSSFGQTDFGHIFRVQMAPQVEGGPGSIRQDGSYESS